MRHRPRPHQRPHTPRFLPTTSILGPQRCRWLLWYLPTTTRVHHLQLWGPDHVVCWGVAMEGITEVRRRHLLLLHLRGHHPTSSTMVFWGVMEVLLLRVPRCFCGMQ